MLLLHYHYLYSIIIYYYYIVIIGILENCFNSIHVKVHNDLRWLHRECLHIICAIKQRF